MTVRIADIAASIGTVALIGYTIHAAAGPKPAEPDPRIARGRYIVRNVAMCSDCHTPRKEGGAFDMSRELKGAALDFAPIHPLPGWEAHAPDITSTGLRGMTVDQVAAMLRDIKRSPPMPNYRMNDADAHAVAAYLLSLK